jgi:hypothetical protein
MGKIRRTISKLIPKEIKPILPYAALFIPGLQGAAGAFAKMGITNALAQKAIIAAATKGLSDDKAKFGDIARTAALAVAPDVIQQGLGSLGNAITPQTTQALKASMSVTGGGNAIPLTQQVGQAATAAAESEFLDTLVNPGTLTQTAKAIASPALTDYSIKQREIQKQELEKYNQQLRERGVTDKIGRRKGIYDIYASIEDEDDSGTYRVYSDDYINSILDKYGYKNGGRIGFEAGGEVATLVAEVKRLQSENAELKSKSGLKEVREGIDYATKGFEQAFGGPLMGQIPSPQRIVPGFGLMNGGRVGFEMGGDVSPTDSDEEGMGGVIYYDEEGKPISQKEAMEYFNRQAEEEYRQKNNKAMGGIINLMKGGMPSMEMDYRGGGFIPVGAKEKADDVPARLSKNEFVMTADAVRAAGGGSVNEGARRMYELMNSLEARV